MKSIFSKIALIASALIPLPVLAAPTSAQCQGANAVGATCNGDALTGALGNVIDAIFFIAGTVAVIVLIIGGVGYMASTGDPTRITKAKNTILYAIVGLIVVILARAIVAFVVGKVNV
ncbi:MAG TPA: pilin [Candidatus Saccharimonadales bacterium]|nr:pilin [Candidatus Saccharimonadales bacterium]